VNRGEQRLKDHPQYQVEPGMLRLSPPGDKVGEDPRGGERAMVDAPRRLIPLGHGVYTVSEVCRILQPTMTPRKVHYWLDTGLLSEPPAAHRGAGRPTLLSFRQLLEVRTVQRMRDDLGVSLPIVREAFSWVLRMLFADSPVDVKFERGSKGRVIARSPDGDGVEIPTSSPST
jgi:hypothetical protein